MNSSGKRFVYFLPFILLFTTSVAFYFFSTRFGQRPGYILGFVFYWLFWCIAIPFVLTGPKSIAALFKVHQPALGQNKIRNISFLVLPLILVYAYEFPKVIQQADTIIIISSTALSIINATAEEILWRGTFLKLMGQSSKWYVPFSSLGFAMWHFAPQIVFTNPNPGGSLSFVAVSFILGLFYSSVVKDTQSILLTTASHILFDFSGLGGRLYF